MVPQPRYPRDSVSLPDPARDGRFGRTWGFLPSQSLSYRVLSSNALSTWIRRPIHIPRPGAVASSTNSRSASSLLEFGGGTDNATWDERQLILDECDRWRFTSTRYNPVLFNEAFIPDDVRTALLDVSETIAYSAFGIRWRNRVRLVSVQVTSMAPSTFRGDHVDLPDQGDFIGTYTAQGSCVVGIECAPDETPSPAALAQLSSRRHKPQIRRIQDPGCFYSIRDASRDKPTEHCAAALEEGRIAITYRFNYVTPT